MLVLIFCNEESIVYLLPPQINSPTSNFVLFTVRRFGTRFCPEKEMGALDLRRT